MAVPGDFTNEYSRYKPNFIPVQSGPNEASQWGQGLQQAGAASMALPWVGAGLQTAGLISSLYGAYEGNQQAERNYELQKKEFEYQRGLESERRRREQEQQSLTNSYSAANKAQSDEDRLMSRYAPYYRGLGL